MKVSVLQIPIKTAGIEHNLDAMSALLAEAMNSEERPDAIVLPELWNIGFYPRPLYDYSDALGTWKRHMSHLATENSVNIVSGTFAVRRNGKIYNTCYIMNRTGEEIASYDKTHLFSPAGEAKDFAAGDHLTTFELDGVKCGVIICYDLRFPEIARQLALQGISILFVPAAWPIERIQHWDILLRARAIENQFFVVGANGIAYQADEKFRIGGGSAIYDPWGSLLAQGSTDNYNGEILHANLQPGVIEQIRSDINIFRDRRPELYR